MNLEMKKVLVAGTGISGIAAINLLNQCGAQVVVYDGNEDLDIDKVYDRISGKKDIPIILGELKKEDLSGVDFAVISPGISCDAPFTSVIKEQDIPIWSEIELAYQAGQGSVLAITGTNGKTTTTALLGAIMKDYYDSVFVVGNIGIPYTEIALETKEDSVIIAEVSSFQLETIDEFKPRISAVLNLTPDHLDRHKTFECYGDTKLRITKNQTDQDLCVLNYEDEYTRAMAAKMSAVSFFFSSERELEKGIYLKNDVIYLREDENEIKVLAVDELKLLGIHNYENVMAAAAMAYLYGVPLVSIQATIKAFAGVAHRIEYVDEVAGVNYYNDSKGTNPDAAIKGIQAMNRPTVLIGGGYDKGAAYEEWIKSFDNKVKCLVLLGATADKIAKTAREYGITNIVKVETLEEAVLVSAKEAEAGDAVLLSPACASWGMFKNFEERGNLFKQYVHNLKE